MLPTIITVNPMAKRRKHRRHYSMNPHRRRHRHHNPFRHRSHHRARNPFSVRSMTSDLVPAAIGGLGAVGLDIVLAYVPLPAALTTGYGNTLAKILGAFGLGYVASMVTDKRKGELVTVGALTVTLYSFIRGLLQSTIGSSVKGLSGLADFQDFRAAGVGAYMRPRIGAYMGPGTVTYPGSIIKAGGAVVPMRPAASSPVARMSGLGRRGVGAYMGRPNTLGPIG